MKTIRMGILGCGPRGMQMARITKLLPEFYTLTCMSPIELSNFKRIFTFSSKFR